MDLYKELEKLKFDLGIIQKVYCGKVEEEEFKRLKKLNQPIPEDIEIDIVNDSHFRYAEIDMTKEEIKELLLYRQVKYLETIKNSIKFFVVLTVMSIILSFFIR